MELPFPAKLASQLDEPCDARSFLRNVARFCSYDQIVDTDAGKTI
jgi:hypothetical protein